MKVEYKGEKMQLSSKLRRYVRQIDRRLDLPKETKLRVMSDVLSGICARCEQGAQEEQIMREMGTPQQVAQSLNEGMGEYVRQKSPWRFVFLAGAVLGLGWSLVYMGMQALIGAIFGFTSNCEAASIGVIGGADGPTSILVAASPRNAVPEWLLALAIGAVCLGIYIWMRRGKLIKKKEE